MFSLFHRLPPLPPRFVEMAKTIDRLDRVRRALPTDLMRAAAAFERVASATRFLPSKAMLDRIDREVRVLDAAILRDESALALGEPGVFEVKSKKD
jgi:hypothetical protein